MKFYHHIFQSPVGKLKIIADDTKLLYILFDNQGGSPCESEAHPKHPILV